MAVDALDPGPNGDYPYFPRDAEGRPVWADSPPGSPVVNGGAPMPRGIQRMRDPGDPRRLVLVDVTPRPTDGTPVAPPVIPPDTPSAA